MVYSKVLKEANPLGAEAMSLPSKELGSDGALFFGKGTLFVEVESGRLASQ